MVNGRRTGRKVRDTNHGPMEPAMWVHIVTTRRRVRGYSSGLMSPTTRASFITTSFKAWGIAL